MAKVLHAADFHLDSAFRALPEEQARLRRQESRELPGRLVDWANDHGARLMLLAGDLFDSDQLYSQTAQMLAQALSRFRGTVVIAPGKSRLALRRQSLPPAHLAGTMFTFSWAGAWSGWRCRSFSAPYTGGLHRPGRTGKRPAGLLCPAGRRARIMVLHGDMGSRESRYRPLTPEEIAATGLDYLGPGPCPRPLRHEPGRKHRLGVSGCPQGRGFDETGERGFLFGDVEPGRVDMRFVPFAGRRYESLTVDVSGGDALDAIRRSLPPDTSRDIYRIRLTGETAEPLTLAPLERALSGEFFRLELRDDTRLRRDLWDRCGDDTLRGLFLGQLRREYDGADPRRQKEIEQAVRFGLAAMDNTIDS